jgi:hypothetical protein
MSRLLNLVFRHYVQAVLTAALLVSTAAHAGPSRGLSLATTEAPPANEAGQPPSDVPQTPSATAPDNQPQGKTIARGKPTAVAKPSRNAVPVEARIIYELHRHGIYW